MCFGALAKHHKKNAGGWRPPVHVARPPPTHNRGSRQPPGGAHLSDPWAMVCLSQVHTRSLPGQNKACCPLAWDHPKLHGGVGRLPVGGPKWHGYRRFGGMCSPPVNSAPLAVTPMEWLGCPKIWPFGTPALRCLRAWRQLRALRARFQGAPGLVWAWQRMGSVGGSSMQEAPCTWASATLRHLRWSAKRLAAVRARSIPKQQGANPR